MPWDQGRPLASQRADSLEAAEEGGHPFTRACADFGIGRKTGYRWLGRSRLPRPRPLPDRPRRPRRPPRRTPGPVERRVLAALVKGRFN